MWARARVEAILRSQLPLWLCALTLALVSVHVSGFRFGINNNVFHIPIVLRLTELPQFRGDAFYESLSGFTSIVWPLLRTVSHESNVESIFRASHYLARGLTFIALAYLLKELGLRLYGVAVSLAVIAATPWLLGFSSVGGHGLFIDYFTHSETTWPLLLLSWIALARAKPATALALTGFIFSINAFVGIWNLSTVAAVLAFANRPHTSIRDLFWGIAGFILLAFPAILWIIEATSQGISGTEDFSYREYIRLYWPGHFLIEASNWRSVLELILLLFGGLAAAATLPNARVWVCILLAVFGLVLIGVPVPYLLDNRFLFNLALLRADGLIHFLSVVLMIAAGVRACIGSGITLRSRLIALVLLLLLLPPTGRELPLLVAIVALTATLWCGAPAGGFLSRDSTIGSTPYVTWIDGAAIAVTVWAVILSGPLSRNVLVVWSLLVVFGPILVWAVVTRNRWLAGCAAPVLVACALCACIFSIQEFYAQARWMSSTRDWRDATGWIRQNGAPGPYLVDLRAPDSDSFQLLARRPVWVDKKQGAAGMWRFDFAPLWMKRYHEVRALRSSSDYLGYARGHGIKAVALEGQPSECAGGWKSAFANERYVVCVDSTDN